MKTIKRDGNNNRKTRNYSNNVVNGGLCKECLHNKLCVNIKCPVYKWRQQQSQR